MGTQGATGHRRQRNPTCIIRISLWVVLHEDEVPWKLRMNVARRGLVSAASHWCFCKRYRQLAPIDLCVQ